MLALWWFGGVVEQALGRRRFLLLYLAAGLAGSAGALLASPHAVTVGASGAIFGILGALLSSSTRSWPRPATGQAMTLIAINLWRSASRGAHRSRGAGISAASSGGSWARWRCSGSAAAASPSAVPTRSASHRWS